MLKKIIKDIFDEKINKNDIYEKTIAKISKRKRRIYTLKIAIPSLIIAMAIIINYSISTNGNFTMSSSNANNSFETVDLPAILNNMNLPNDLKRDTNDAVNSNYTSIIYKNDDRYILISFSNTSKFPIYQFEQTISIENVPIKISKDGNKYVLEFVYDYYNINIKTDNIEYEELMNLLNSIIRR